MEASYYPRGFFGTVFSVATAIHFRPPQNYERLSRQMVRSNSSVRFVLNIICIFCILEVIE